MIRKWFASDSVKGRHAVFRSALEISSSTGSVSWSLPRLDLDDKKLAGKTGFPTQYILKEWLSDT